MDNSGIGWTDHTWNPWWGCNKVSAECKHCYISGIMSRAGKEPFDGPLRTETWNDPPRWNRTAGYSGRRLRIFTCSMSDFFHEGADAWREEAWKVIETCRNLDWLILTKRPENIASRLPQGWGLGWPHVWLGTTCGIESSLHRVDELLSVRAKVRFVSAEPLLGPVKFGSRRMRRLDWLITGCESANKDVRTAMNLDWVREH